MSCVVLFGDSIFDNGRYVPGGPALIEQLRTALPASWDAQLLARDGSTIEDVAIQLRGLPVAATHLVVSVGGNDALGYSPIIADWSITAAEGFEQIADVQREFRTGYQQMLAAVLALGKPTVVSTIYDAIPDYPPKALTGLAIFNDVIFREAFRAGLPVLDLRLVCSERCDYSPVSPIEPSRVGGGKIARRIAHIVTRHDFLRVESVVYGA